MGNKLLVPPGSFIKGKRPEVNHLIRVWGYDFQGLFTAVGMMIPYSPKKCTPKRLRGKPRFCLRKPDGSFETSRDIWADVERWEYVSSDETRKDEKNGR